MMMMMMMVSIFKEGGSCGSQYVEGSFWKSEQNIINYSMGVTVHA